MWPFKKATQESVVGKDKILYNHTFTNDGGTPYLVRVGLTRVGQSDRYRVFFVLNPSGRELKIYPRQSNFELPRATKVAHSLIGTLQFVYDMSVEQKVCDCD